MHAAAAAAPHLSSAAAGARDRQNLDHIFSAFKFHLSSLNRYVELGLGVKLEEGGFKFVKLDETSQSRSPGILGGPDSEFELATDCFQFYAIANLDKTSL